MSQLLDCGHPVPVLAEGHVGGTGYGTTADGKKHCYACCGLQDLEAMKKDGRITLYLSCSNDGNTAGLYGNKRPAIGTYMSGKVSNWPSSIVFKAQVKVGDHNLAGRRYDTWFDGPDGFVWHGVQYGDNTQIVHCKRTKERLPAMR